jgi:hypothetical protein
MNSGIKNEGSNVLVTLQRRMQEINAGGGGEKKGGLRGKAAGV